MNNHKRAKVSVPSRQVDDNNKCIIKELPDEILLHIFSHVTPHVLLLTTLSIVCLRWRQLCSDASLFKRLVFKDSYPDLSMVVEMLRKAPWLQRLELCGREDVDDILWHLRGCCPLLERLDITGCRGRLKTRKVSSENLRKVLTCCPKLRSLSLQGTCFTDTAIYEEIGNLAPSLTAIKFGEVPEHLATEALMGIADNCVLLEEIQIDCPAIDEKVVQTLWERYSESLRVIQLFKCNIWTEYNIETLTKFSKLENIHLYDSLGIITEEELRYINLIPNLKQVELDTFTYISTECWVDLLGSPNMMNLQALVMRHCNVNDDVLSVLRVLPSLEVLFLKGNACQFSDRGLLSISDIPKLFLLGLGSNGTVTSDGWKRFFKKPTTKTITTLILQECKQLDDNAALMIMKHLLALKNLIMDSNSKISERMMRTFLKRMEQRTCICQIVVNSVNCKVQFIS